MKRSDKIVFDKNTGGMVLVIGFLLIQLLFQLELFSLAFFILLAAIICVPFMKETNRMFVWSSFGFFIGLFAYIYGERLLLELSFSRGTLLILTRLLLFLPILFMAYVIYHFKRPIISFLNKPQWKEHLFIPLIWIRSLQTSVKVLFIITNGLIVIIFLPFMLTDFSIEWSLLWKVFLFSLANGALIEVLWRGILLTQMTKVVGEEPAVIVTSLSAALLYYMFGFSLLLCTGFAVISFLLGGMTIRSKSIIPAIVTHIIFTVAFISSGLLTL